MDSNLSEQIERYAETANAMVSETRLQFDTLLTMQHDERIEMQKMHDEEKSKMRKHYGRIIFGLILALVVLLGGIICGLAYVLTIFDFGSTYQETYVDGDGNATIYDGIHINEN